MEYVYSLISHATIYTQKTQQSHYHFSLVCCVNFSTINTVHTCTHTFQNEPEDDGWFPMITIPFVLMGGSLMRYYVTIAVILGKKWKTFLRTCTKRRQGNAKNVSARGARSPKRKAWKEKTKLPTHQPSSLQFLMEKKVLPGGSGWLYF